MDYDEAFSPPDRSATPTASSPALSQAVPCCADTTTPCCRETGLAHPPLCYVCHMTIDPRMYCCKSNAPMTRCSEKRPREGDTDTDTQQATGIDEITETNVTRRGAV
eukprot:PhF_6_TR5607/c0_g1_i1/m.8094